MQDGKESGTAVPRNGSTAGERAYDAVLFDLDGTLLADDGRVRPRVREAVDRVRAMGVHVMVCTGRSVISTRPVLEDLGLEMPAVTFNGAVLWDPVSGRALEEMVLSNSTFERSLAFAREHDLLSVVMRVDSKFSTAPRSEAEELALRYLSDLRTVEREKLHVEYPIRVTMFGSAWPDSDSLCGALEQYLARPCYLTHFPLHHLPNHRGSALQVVDVHGPCRGKAEGLRILRERYGVPAERVIAVGDAMNDVPMLLEAGLGVAMANGMPCAHEAADRIIGSNQGDAIADLLDEVLA